VNHSGVSLAHRLLFPERMEGIMNRSRIASCTFLVLAVGVLACAAGCSPQVTGNSSGSSDQADDLTGGDDFIGNKRVGEACKLDIECAGSLGLVCRFGRSCQLPAENGVDCDRDAECGSGMCGAYLWCAAPGKNGARCNANVDCAADFYCKSSSYDDDHGSHDVQACAPRAKEGKACWLDGECAEGICDFVEGAGRVCISLSGTRVGEYGYCEQDFHCGAGLVCRPMFSAIDRCVMPGVAGSKCSNYEDCIDGLACDYDGYCN